MKRSKISIGLLLFLGACARSASSNAPVTEPQALDIAIAAESSFTSSDAGKIMQQYAQRAVIIDASAPQPSDDPEVTSGWTRYFVSMKPAGFKVSDRRIQLVGPDAFVSSGIQHFTVAAGAARPAVSARFTDVFKRETDGGWKIVHEHVSIPLTSAGRE